MDETYNIKAIVLNRIDFRENDSRITVYSKEKGKMSLVVRGAKKSTSKLSSHIEIITLSDIMVVVGKKMNYVGGVKSENCYANIKKDFSKSQITGEAFSFFDKIIKPDYAELAVFELLEDFLFVMNNRKFSFFTEEGEVDKNFPQYRIFLYAFVIKLLAILGYEPNLKECVVCKKEISNNKLRIDYLKGGLLCRDHGQQDYTEISANVVKFMRLLFKERLFDFIKYKIEEKDGYEFINTVKSFIKYQNII